jgi:hypothetical protein
VPGGFSPASGQCGYVQGSYEKLMQSRLKTSGNLMIVRRLY